jgi:hypothetical protein
MSDKSVDWSLVLINTPISLYLPKVDIVNLSSTSKLLRSKFTLLIFKSIVFDDKVLFNQNKYFMNKKILEFRAKDSWWDLRFIAKNWFNNELVFKEAHIDSFIKDINRQLKQNAFHCKSLRFECLGKACYFLFPLTLEFSNLRTLSLNTCVISLDQLNGTLESLANLEVLELKCVDIINSLGSNSTNSISLPRNLRSLTYINNKSASSDLPNLKPIKFLTTDNIIDITPSNNLFPQHLPKLAKLNYYSITLTEEFTGLLNFNNQIEDLSLPITLLSSIKNNIRLLKNLKKLKLFAQNFRYEQVTADNLDIPAFPNLEELSLNLRTSTELEFAELLIKKCGKLFRLNVVSNNLEYKKLKELVKFANGLRYFNNEKII